MTLTEVSILTRRTINYLGIAFVVLIIGSILWKIGLPLWRKISPENPKATILFGKLQPLALSGEEKTQYTFSLETPTIQLPELPKVAQVFPYISPESSFDNLSVTSQLAKTLGFTGKVTSLTNVIYRFEHKDLPSHLDINIINKTFSLNYNLTQTPEILMLQPASTQNALASIVSFLTRAGLLPEDLDQTNPKFDLLKTQGGELTQAISLSEANLVRVNLFRSNYAGLPLVAKDSQKANVWFLVSGENQEGKKIIAGEYHYFPIDVQGSSTYPLKDAEVAWNELLSGTASIINSPKDATTIPIRKIYLAYYDPGEFQQFMQPIIVFEGPNFLAYLPAITGDYYSQ